MKATKLFAPVPLMMLLLTACTSDDVVDSTGVSTSSMSAEIHVSYSGSQNVSVETMLRRGTIGSSTDINLVDGDSLVASTLGDPANLDYSDNLFDNLVEVSNQVKTMRQGNRYIFGELQTGIWYYTNIDAEYRGKTFTISLLREDQDDARNSTVNLPPEFSTTIAELQTSQLLSRSGPMTLTWNPPAPTITDLTMKISGLMACSDGFNDELSLALLADNDVINGSYTIAADTFSGSAVDCSITIRLDRSRLGHLDPAFGQGGIVRGHQYRTIVVNTVQ